MLESEHSADLISCIAQRAAGSVLHGLRELQLLRVQRLHAAVDKLRLGLRPLHELSGPHVSG